MNSKLFWYTAPIRLSMVRKYQELGTERIAALLEQTSSDLARRAVDHGYTRIISAGGYPDGWPAP